jgi:glutathione S-transferase
MDELSMPYVLYWNPFSGSLAPMAVLEEIGIHYEKILIDMDKGEHRSTEYLTIQPLGLVPAMRLTNGRYAYESAGICMYLAARHPERGKSRRLGSETFGRAKSFAPAQDVDASSSPRSAS